MIKQSNEPIHLCVLSIVAVCFTRATLCVSAVFAVVRCLSVRHIGGLYPHGWSYRHSLLLVQPGSPITLVFLTPSADTQFQGEPAPSARAQNTRGWEKNCDSPSISEMVRDKKMVIYVTLIGNHRWRIDVSVPMTFDLISRSRHCSKSNISKTVHCRDKITIEH